MGHLNKLSLFQTKSIFRSFGFSFIPSKFVDNQQESEDDSELDIDLEMLQVSTPDC